MSLQRALVCCTRPHRRTPHGRLKSSQGLRVVAVPSDAGLSVGWLAVQAVATALWAAPPRCVCECVTSGAPDQALLKLLHRQLDRCGPEHLVGIPPGPVGCPVGYLVVVAVCAFWLGVLAAVLCVVAVR